LFMMYTPIPSSRNEQSSPVVTKFPVTKFLLLFLLVKMTL